MKALLQKHLISVLCAISIIALAFPLCIVITDVSVMGFGDSARAGYNGFQAMQESLLAILLLVVPVLLIAMNYIKKLEKYQGILAIAVPVIRLAALIVVCISSDSFTSTAEILRFSPWKSRPKSALAPSLPSSLTSPPLWQVP